MCRGGPLLPHTSPAATNSAMYDCPHCYRSIDVELPLSAGAACPFCGAELAPARSPEWTSVARVTNLAEAGYLANDLSTHGIKTRIFDAESFCAVSGGWSAAYLIQVPTTNSQAAAARIRSHLADEAADDRYDYQQSFPDGADDPVDVVFWRPVALMVIAGVASFILGQHLAAERLPARQQLPRNSLPALVDGIGRSFVTEPVAGGPRHRLSFHHGQNCWYLETDADGDGRYESYQRFRRNGASW